ncbi:MAG: hypothetical protein QNK35_02450 [Bacteroides sp.]|nr:hypothetical protein [Bacteroides sp.]
MKTNRFLLVCMAFLLSSAAFGQKIKIVSGNISDLQGMSELNIEYDYSGLGVGKFDVEADYLDKKVADKNEDEAGSGDLWKQAWFDDRPIRFEPKFEELLNNYAPVINSGQDVEAEITMLVHTTFIEPGYNVGVSRKPAMINLELIFSRGDEQVLVMTLTKSPGSGAMGYDFDTGYRISEAYAKAGKSLGKYLMGKLY